MNDCCCFISNTRIPINFGCHVKGIQHIQFRRFSVYLSEFCVIKERGQATGTINNHLSSVFIFWDWLTDCPTSTHIIIIYHFLLLLQLSNMRDLFLLCFSEMNLFFSLCTILMRFSCIWSNLATARAFFVSFTFPYQKLRVAHKELKFASNQWCVLL